MSTVIAAALLSFIFGSNLPLLHLKIHSLQALLILLTNVVSAFFISENEHDPLAITFLPNSLVAKTEKNFEASSLVMFAFGKKSATVDFDVSPALYIQVIALLSSSFGSTMIVSGIVVVSVPVVVVSSPKSIGAILTHIPSHSTTTKESIIALPGPAIYFPLLIIALLPPLSN